MAESNPDISNEVFSSRMLFKTIRSRFPKVNQISTNCFEELLLQKESEETVLVVDVRERQEQSISSLENAVFISPNNQNMDKILCLIESKPISNVVAFCSMGYRSCEFVQKLYKCLDTSKRSSITLYNLEGGLFKWANENKRIVDDKGMETSFVHPYNVVWGKFLEYDKRKYQLDEK
ncbi:uncharacterized protein [Clytia hemisphaerica]|uniref:uncharacterized protein n=1 Tax=Clytia hemisphaerica TaxID=252671 RepID=UPI0034D6148D